MDNLVVASIQQRMRLPQTLEEYEADLDRFMRVAQSKNARLVLFAELAGVMAAPPLMADGRSNLLKRADQGRRRQANLWQKLSGSMAGTMAGWVKADFRASLAALLAVDPGGVWQAYVQVFGNLARRYGVHVVAPSAFLPDPADGIVRNMAGVFGPSGELLGQQAKVILHREDEDLAQPGTSWDVIPTEIGRIGLMLGSDVLYPEVGRLLAYQGAEMLIAQGAAPNMILYNKLRAAMLARMQDNQLFGAISFMVGRNELSRADRDPYVGKSAIFAPQELTPRYSGVLVEMGNARSEGVLAANWDFVALRRLWEESDTPVRQQLPQASQLLARLYERLNQLPRPMNYQALPEIEQTPMEFETAQGARFADLPPVRSLDDLPVINAVTARWPLNGDSEDMVDLSGSLSDATLLTSLHHIPGQSNEGDETEEMDVIDDQSDQEEDLGPSLSEKGAR